MRTIFAALCAMLALAPAAARAKDTVRIAFVGPLTGGNSAIGLGGRNSADLAVKLRNQDAKAKYTYDLVVLDDECKPDTGVQVATKSGSDRSVVAGVTHYCSVVAMATVDTYHRFGLPVVVWGAVLPDITATCSPFQMNMALREAGLCQTQRVRCTRGKRCCGSHTTEMGSAAVRHELDITSIAP